MKKTKDSPSDQEKNRVYLWLFSLLNILCKLQMFERLYPKSKKLFADLPEKPENIDQEKFYDAMEVQVSIVCIEESSILAYYNLFSKSNSGGNNVSSHKSTHVRYMKKQLKKIIDSSEDYKNLHNKLLGFRNNIIAHHSGQEYEIIHSSKGDIRKIEASRERIHLLMSEEEMQTFKYLITELYDYLRVEQV